mmetsp:Transcript_82412/g.212339  ORF Transcript_82412/g.212339 Transcript_82412/m.212339 type:complete len:217 (+) Transcript_82412:692-1342(+)
MPPRFVALGGPSPRRSLLRRHCLGGLGPLIGTPDRVLGEDHVVGGVPTLFGRQAEVILVRLRRFQLVQLLACHNHIATHLAHLLCKRREIAWRLRRLLFPRWRWADKLWTVHPIDRTARRLFDPITTPLLVLLVLVIQLIVLVLRDALLLLHLKPERPSRGLDEVHGLDEGLRMRRRAWQRGEATRDVDAVIALLRVECGPPATRLVVRQLPPLII